MNETMGPGNYGFMVLWYGTHNSDTLRIYEYDPYITSMTRGFYLVVYTCWEGCNPIKQRGAVYLFLLCHLSKYASLSMSSKKDCTKLTIIK